MNPNSLLEFVKGQVRDITRTEPTYPDSPECFRRSLQVAPGGVHSPVRAFKSVGGTPIFFKKAKGAYLMSVEGATYLDYCMSFGPLILGHRDPDVQAEVEQAIHSAWSFGACEPYSLELAEWITQRIAWVQKVRFVSSGTEAVMSALRLARAATGRERILKFEGCYHGHVDSMLVKSGSGLAGAAVSDSAGVPASTATETLVAPLDDEKRVGEIFSEHGSDIAAVIIEPLPANYGLLVQRNEFIRQVVQLARANGTLVIFDEVISGFRVALGGMAEVLGIQPDLVTYGKVIGGGFPVGCYGGRGDLMDMIAPNGPVYQAGTLSANPVGVRAGLATLKKLEATGAHHILEKRTQALARELNHRLDRLGAPFQICSFASLFWLHARAQSPIRAISQIPQGQGESFKKIFNSALDKGIYLAPSGYEVGFVSTAHSDAMIEQTIDALEAAARELVT